jgi:hypothetical protein
MPEYLVNKGVNKSAEFKGLKAQYLYIFAGSLLGSFLLFIIIYVLGVPIFACIIIVLVITSVLFYYVFKLNREYGEFGLMKLTAKKGEPKLLYQKGRLCNNIRENTQKRKREKMEKKNGR